MRLNGTDVQEVLDLFLSKIKDYDFLELNEDELYENIEPMLKSACAKCLGIDLTFEYGMFTRELSPIEQELIALRLLAEWMSPHVFDVEMFRERLTMKDYNDFSKANFLKQKQELLTSVKKEAEYWQTRVGFHNHVMQMRKK